MAEIKHVTDSDFEEIVLKSDRPVVVDFWAAWCGPCKMIAPALDELADTYAGRAKVVKIDIDQKRFAVLPAPLEIGIEEPPKALRHTTFSHSIVVRKP